MRYLPFILFTVLTNAAAQIMLKQGMTNLSAVTFGALSFTPDTLVGKVGMALLNPWVIAGLTTFVISMASHMYVLSKVELSFAYPFLSLAYVLVAIAAWSFFGEDLNAYRIAGIGLICAGTVLIAQGGAGRLHGETAAAKPAPSIMIAKLSE
ncbi:MAG: EamA family transporter [Rhizobiaceae bacterium]|jgi:drug/metabolite transporter (DMT)-like permease|nr:EamA family transporter [Rhizobiaceae bacterium]